MSCELKIVLIASAKLPREHLTIQLFCLICMLSRGVRPCVPGVNEGSKDAALL